jgi:RNase P/RNase MRP subunit POP5
MNGHSIPGLTLVHRMENHPLSAVWVEVSGNIRFMKSAYLSSAFRLVNSLLT